MGDSRLFHFGNIKLAIAAIVIIFLLFRYAAYIYHKYGRERDVEKPDMGVMWGTAAIIVFFIGLYFLFWLIYQIVKGYL